MSHRISRRDLLAGSSKALLAGALLTAPTSMTVRDSVAWAEWKTTNTDPYGAAALRYAELWARLMEGQIARGATLAECAEEAAHLADDDGVTGFQHSCALHVLGQCWAHGPALLEWAKGDHR